MEPRKREAFKFIELYVHKFRIGKFDALTGSYQIYQLTNFGMPKSKEGFQDLQKDCLKVCSEIIADIPTPIITADGRFSLKELETNTELLLELTMESLGFNVEGFFDEGALKESKTKA